MRSSTLLLVVVVSFVLFGRGNRCGSGQNPPVLKDEKLEGTWRLVYHQRNGAKVPDERTAQLFQGKMVISDGKIHYTVELPGFDFEFSYRLHPNQRPKGIDLRLTNTPDKRDLGQGFLGIYEMDEETLKICYNKTNRPMTFSAMEGSQNQLIVLKRNQTKARE